MIKFLPLLFLSLLLGCAANQRQVDEIRITKNIEPVQVLHPPLPEGVVWEEFEIVVLTPDIMRDMLAKVNSGEIDEGDAVFAALTPKGYESLALNLADIKRFIEDQQSVIMYYKGTIPDEVFLPKEEEE